MIHTQPLAEYIPGIPYTQQYVFGISKTTLKKFCAGSKEQPYIGFCFNTNSQDLCLEMYTHAFENKAQLLAMRDNVPDLEFVCIGHPGATCSKSQFMNTAIEAAQHPQLPANLTSNAARVLFMINRPCCRKGILYRTLAGRNADSIFSVGFYPAA